MRRHLRPTWQRERRQQPAVGVQQKPSSAPRCWLLLRLPLSACSESAAHCQVPTHRPASAAAAVGAAGGAVAAEEYSRRGGRGFACGLSRLGSKRWCAPCWPRCRRTPQWRPTAPSSPLRVRRRQMKGGQLRPMTRQQPQKEGPESQRPPPVGLPLGDPPLARGGCNSRPR